MPHLARIQLFPVKSFDPMPCSAVRVLASGALENDRRFALRYQSGRFFNGKRSPRVHSLRTCVDPETRTVTLRQDESGEAQRFHIDTERTALENWLSQFFDEPILLEENAEAGLPDDIEANGPTLVSRSTLDTVASWYDNMSVEEIRLRFRVNLEIDGVEPFWEDRLFAHENAVVRFRIGRVLFDGVNPCARCVVPSRSPVTGAADVAFQRTFLARRRETLPAWAERSRFDHFYRLAVNTRVAQLPNEPTLHIGDPVEVGGIQPLCNG
jgi:hypothetical protein